jgi:hypothetical protein
VASDKETLQSEKVNASTMTSVFVDSGNAASPGSDFATVQAELESAKMTISRLEDQVQELHLRLEELKAESDSHLEVARLVLIQWFSRILTSLNWMMIFSLQTWPEVTKK